ncbi:MAG: Flp pilus assembly complex ATPase component TadA [Bradyrhizobiaceae bacterium]|nr:Flp pilus assembly complex ATPase component TadA [Bradyrhizobiaceae bacterium]
MHATSPTSFADHLASKKLLRVGAAAAESPSIGQSGGLALTKLWEGTDLSASDFANEVAQFYNVPRVSLPDMLAVAALTKLFSRRFLREMLVFPYVSADGQVTLAAADPGDTAAIRAAEIVIGGQIAIRTASFDDINTILNQRLGEEDTASPVGMQPTAVRDDDIESLRDLASGAPVVRAVNDLLEKAVELRATDIHIEPFRAGLTVRMRVDGLMRAVPPPAGVPPQALVSRIKILSGLNIAERRLPQDGASRLRIGPSEIDIRVAIMPTQHGESAVLRLLPKDRGLLGIEKLGFRPDDEAKLRRLLNMPHGMIVVTGPTGSGKTTTLATMLTVLNESTRKILTIEDPVEYEIAGINQSQIKPGIGLTFASALRAFVRQDPDVIMVGEIRDSETAHIAIHAALTGHLVLTTLHTETAAAAVPRLIDLGVEDFLLKSTLRAVIAQRLVRQLCERCKASYTLTRDDLEADPRYSALGLHVGEEVYEPSGCEHCGSTGYRGRVGIFEILEVNEDIRRLINAQSDSTTIDQVGVGAGMTTMINDGLAKCRAGTTSAAEVLRVTTIR